MRRSSKKVGRFTSPRLSPPPRRKPTPASLAEGRISGAFVSLSPKLLRACTADQLAFDPPGQSQGLLRQAQTRIEILLQIGFHDPNSSKADDTIKI
jgi:hypothetical protein